MLKKLKLYDLFTLEYDFNERYIIEITEYLDIDIIESLDINISDDIANKTIWDIFNKNNKSVFALLSGRTSSAFLIHFSKSIRGQISPVANVNILTSEQYFKKYVLTDEIKIANSTYAYGYIDEKLCVIKTSHNQPDLNPINIIDYLNPTTNQLNELRNFLQDKSGPASVFGILTELTSAEINYLYSGQKLQAVKHLKDRIGLGLKECKDIVDHYEQTHIRSLNDKLVKDPQTFVYHIITKEEIYQIQTSNKLNAIKMIKDRNNCSLMKAKDIVDNYVTYGSALSLNEFKNELSSYEIDLILQDNCRTAAELIAQRKQISDQDATLIVNIHRNNLHLHK